MLSEARALIRALSTVSVTYMVYSSGFLVFGKRKRWLVSGVDSDASDFGEGPQPAFLYAVEVVNRHVVFYRYAIGRAGAHLSAERALYKGGSCEHAPVISALGRGQGSNITLAEEGRNCVNICPDCV